MYIFKIPKYSLKIFSNYVFSAKIALNYFYATFKQWLQKVKSPYTYSSLIKLIPKFMMCTLCIHNNILF